MRRRRRRRAVYSNAFARGPPVYSVSRSSIVPYRAEQMFELVADVDAYPAFLPWCGGARVVERSGDEVVAEIAIAYHGIHRTFRTRNLNRPGREILIRLVSGPFSHLRGRWSFDPMGEDACRVSLDIEFDFSGRIIGRLVGPVFRQISGSLVDAFCSRARLVFGR